MKTRCASGWLAVAGLGSAPRVWRMHYVLRRPPPRRRRSSADLARARRRVAQGVRGVPCARGCMRPWFRPLRSVCAPVSAIARVHGRSRVLRSDAHSHNRRDAYLREEPSADVPCLAVAQPPSPQKLGFLLVRCSPPHRCAQTTFHGRRQSQVCELRRWSSEQRVMGPGLHTELEPWAVGRRRQVSHLVGGCLTNESVVRHDAVVPGSAIRVRARRVHSELWVWSAHNTG